jgi:phage-related protein
MPATKVVLYRQGRNGPVPAKAWLDELRQREPKAYAKCLNRILLLAQFGNELRRPHADLLDDGIFELRARSGTVQYRLLYFFEGKNVAVISHGLTKEGKVPKSEIEYAKRHRAQVRRSFDQYTADWET